MTLNRSQFRLVWKMLLMVILLGVCPFYHSADQLYKFVNNEKSQLLHEAEKEKKRAKLLQPIIKAVHLIDPRAQIRLEFFENGEPKHLSIYVYVATDQLSSEEINKNEEELKKKGFEVEKTSWCLNCSKFISLRGTETKEELLEIAKKMMAG